MTMIGDLVRWQPRSTVGKVINTVAFSIIVGTAFFFALRWIY